jgi:hypothetical protein
VKLRCCFQRKRESPAMPLAKDKVVEAFHCRINSPHWRDAVEPTVAPNPKEKDYC